MKGFISAVVVATLVATAQAACEGTCHYRKCPKGEIIAEPPTGKCDGKREVCCIKANQCSRAGGICSTNKKCGVSLQLAATQKHMCPSKREACCIPSSVIYANCRVTGSVSGNINLKQAVGQKLVVKLSLSGFNTSDDYTKHGIHVHTLGDLSGGCGSAGGHYNPEGRTHGAPGDGYRHVGDFGNFDEDNEGNINAEHVDNIAKLSGPFNIIGRSFVIHAKADDLGKGGNSGSLASGNAGPRLGCCVIGLSDGRAFA